MDNRLFTRIMRLMTVPRLRDVARLAGVHAATASRALNPATRSMVSAETAQRVLEAAAQLGYVANPIARSLKTNRTNSIGVVIPDLTNLLFPPIVRGIDDVLSPLGYSLLLVNTDNDKEREAAHIASLRARQVDGLILATALLEDPLLQRLGEQRVPLVLINRRMNTPGFPSVTGDDAGGVYLAVHHLVTLGHRRIAHLAGPQHTSTGQFRLRAYRQALQDLGLPHDDDLVAHCSAWTEAEGARGLAELLDRGVEFTAVLAGNDLLALGCYDLMRERGIHCPDELSIVGFNDMPIVDKLQPALTTVRIPHYRVGSEAAHMLLERLHKPDTPAKSILLPLELVVRGSTAPPASSRRPGGARQSGETTLRAPATQDRPDSVSPSRPHSPILTEL
ncbi:transcriptional regulator, LacI family [Acidothermus cellulolyticus 11B]|uniref:Transcriptional regulator, LacI family n=2 Tax=Acidothermus cellulolyticus TaxID=28049 RepID=A0LTA5_ACIC1|nr:transcriptional regulator, LacI family [Acidothermus cellulolyticus 11B]